MQQDSSRYSWPRRPPPASLLGVVVYREFVRDASVLSVWLVCTSRKKQRADGGFITWSSSSSGTASPEMALVTVQRSPSVSSSPKARWVLAPFITHRRRHPRGVLCCWLLLEGSLAFCLQLKYTVYFFKTDNMFVVFILMNFKLFVLALCLKFKLSVRHLQNR